MKTFFQLVSKSLFSTSGVFLMILIAFALSLAIPSVEPIMTKLGFETKTALKGEATLLKAQRDQAVQSNKSLAKSLDEVTRQHEQTQRQLEEHRKDVKVVEKVMAATEVKHRAKSNVAFANIKKTSTSEDGRLTYEAAAIEAHSAVQIDALHEAFEALYDNTQITEKV